MNSSCHFVQTLYPSPLGILRIISDSHGLVAILWPGEKWERIKLPNLLACTGTSPYSEQARRLLDQYFSQWWKAAQRNVETSLDTPVQSISLAEIGPLSMNQCTPFTQEVIKLLANIPPNTTCSYKTLTEQTSCPKAIRAVASAVGMNPFGILLPCHRVIGSDGKMHGFSWGIERKEALLRYEKEYFL